MPFNSFLFLFVFLPLTFLAVRTTREAPGSRIPIAILTIASFIFYASSSVFHLALLLGLMVLNYGCAQAIAFASTGLGRRSLLGLGCVINLLFLGYFKYRVLGANTLNDLFGLGIHTTNVVLPLGISFFIFQKIAFLADAYAGRIREFDFQHYCLFVSFFPQMIAGPIVHYPDMQPQFERQPWRNIGGAEMVAAISFICIGLFKKVVFADNIAQLTNTVFDAAGNGRVLGFWDAWAGCLSFGLEIYFDFSGYSDIAIGLALLFGIRLPFNFDSPYKSRSIIEFWRRWHITLSQFLRNYLYIQLGGNRRGLPRRYVNLLVTMALGGLWHGAAWTFISWGLLQGVLLSINHLWREMFPRPVLPDSIASRALATILSWAATFIATNLAWCLFRAPTFAAAGKLLEGMLLLNSGDAAVLGWAAAPIIGGGICWVTLLPNSQEVVEQILQRGSGALALIGAGDGLVFLCTVYFMMVNRYEQFIYFMF